ncbi:unnamed protein product, partial [Ectocarpus sp. 8 AP-2014]
PARSPVPATPDPASSALPTLSVVRSKVVSAGCAVANGIAVDCIDARFVLATETPACSISPSATVDDSPRRDRLLRPAGSVRRGLRLPSIADGVNPSAKSSLTSSMVSSSPMPPSVGPTPRRPADPSTFLSTSAFPRSSFGTANEGRSG